jgi:phospholipid-transporting ATPase
MQMVPAITLSDGKPTIFIPLFLVVLVSMIKDFIEDLQRHKNDKKENEGDIEILTPIGFARRQWQDIMVGHIIRIKKEQYLPCDIILLDHNPEHKTAFIETKNLDGETNLKLKKSCQNLNNLRSMPELDLYNIRLEFAYEKPNPFLSSFNGNVKDNEVVLCLFRPST